MDFQIISSLYAPRIVPWASHLASFPTLLLLVFFFPSCGIVFQRINCCHLTLSLTHYFQIVVLFFFPPAAHRVLWPLLKWCQQQQGKQTPICTIKDFKGREALTVFIYFFIFSPERMFLFSICSPLKHFPVFL